MKHSGLEDLTVGAQQVVLYENGEFYLELGLGGLEGTYHITKDTVRLSYLQKPKEAFWPNKLLMTEKYFITIPPKPAIESIRIVRHM